MKTKRDKLNLPRPAEMRKFFSRRLHTVEGPFGVGCLHDAVAEKIGSLLRIDDDGTYQSTNDWSFTVRFAGEGHRKGEKLTLDQVFALVNGYLARATDEQMQTLYLDWISPAIT
jgi:hypothetical protein